MKDDLQSRLSLFLGIMKTWADQWLIKFSVEKTKSMFVRYQGNTDDKFIFNNHDLDNVSIYKHLGVII